MAANDSCPLLCPVRAIALLRQIIGDENITPDTPLFQTRDYHGNLRPILRHKFDAWYRFRLREMDLDATKYTLHGWRSGGIQQVLMSENNLALAKLTSDHTSDVILEYSQVPANRRLCRIIGYVVFLALVPIDWKLARGTRKSVSSAQLFSLE